MQHSSCPEEQQELLAWMQQVLEHSETSDNQNASHAAAAESTVEPGEQSSVRATFSEAPGLVTVVLALPDASRWVALAVPAPSLPCVELTELTGCIIRTCYCCCCMMPLAGVCGAYCFCGSRVRYLLCMSVIVCAAITVCQLSCVAALERLTWILKTPPL